MKKHLLAHVFLSSLYFATLCWAKDSPPQPKVSHESSPQHETFLEAKEMIANFYVDPVTDDKLYQGAIDGMLNHLDPHSSYLTQAELESLSEHAKGEFGGIGIEMTQEYGVVKVISPIDDTPAFHAGLKAGDYIIWINDQPVMGMSLQEIFSKLRGTKGTSVKIRVVREGQDPFDVTIVRDIIKVKPVKYRIENNVGYIRISMFNEKTEKMLKEAVEDIRKQLKEKLLGFVIDLRNNPGGVLDQAVSVADLFLGQGEIVSVRGRDPKKVQRFNATPGDIAEGYPIAVLINAGSASASEIVAGALQDHKRAIVVGNRSFGKGSVQLVTPLKSKKGALKMTIALYYPPSGTTIQGNGITPDVIINQAKVEQVDDKRRREENLERTLKPLPALEKEREKLLSRQQKEEGAGDNDKKDKLKEENTGAMRPEGAPPAKLPESENDYQLARTFDLLKAYAIFHHKGIKTSEHDQSSAIDVMSILKK